MKLLIFSVLVVCALCFSTNNTNGVAVPIIVLHGYGGWCDEPLVEYLSEKLTIYATCIEPSPIPEDGPIYSTITPIQEQGKRACEMINNNAQLQGEFDLIGFSQGTILSRYIIQNCDSIGRVRNFISFGGPLNGQYPIACTWYDFF
jgi:uncharacterized alpha/beta hydrolase family protein